MKHFVLAATVAAMLAAASGRVMAQASASASVRKLDMSEVRDLDRDNVRIVQSALQRRGFDPGPIDGIVGPLTRAAVRKFQEHYGMEGQGQIDNQLLWKLRSATEEGASSPGFCARAGRTRQLFSVRPVEPSARQKRPTCDRGHSRRVSYGTRLSLLAQGALP